MSRTRVKICGIGSLDDAQTAILAGADALGFVFYENSPRYITIERAAYISQHCPPFINLVGLFVDADEAYIREVLDRVAINSLQFHGQETEQVCVSYNKPYIKAVRMTSRTDLFAFCQRYSSAAGLLLDSYVKDVPGGTGTLFDWELIPNNLNKPIILAGGLDETNVKKAVERIRPYAVDVSGGVEKQKGIKDPSKIVNFISEVMRV